MVGTKPGSRLSDLLLENLVEPASVTFVSIDVDGVDLEIFENLGCTPPVILIEGGFNFTPYLARVPHESH